MKRPTQAQKVKLEGFYAQHKASTPEEKAVAIRKFLGMALDSDMPLKELEMCFVYRIIQHV